MQECLVSICKEFETCSNFLNEKTEEKTNTINKIFMEFMECFASLKAEKLDYPKEFINDVKYYNEGNEPLVKKFEDIEMRYLMLSDFYDFCRITKKI
ncbi:hypothetical protein [Sulfurimonas sp.]|uniref:hypothetical protein n=1 Tax=Sulfurimonas sp. TaxID=2022749 RepID=UPI003566CA9E